MPCTTIGNGTSVQLTIMRERYIMIKLFAILTVLAALPVSALASPSTPPPGSVHCDKDVVDTAYTQTTTPVINKGVANTTLSANQDQVQE